MALVKVNLGLIHIINKFYSTIAQIQTVESLLKFPHRKLKRRVASVERRSALTASEIHTGLLPVVQLRDTIMK